MPELAYTYRIDEMCEAIVGLLENRREDIGLAAVYYGDQELIPEFPAVAVEPAPKSRSIRSTHEYEIRLRVTVFIHHEKIQSSQLTRKQTDALAEDVEVALHEDRSFGGMLINSFVVSSDPGVSLRRTAGEQVMLRTTRLSWEGLSKQRF